MDGFRAAFSLLAALGTLAMGAVAARARRHPLARAIAALCFCLFGWNIAVVAQHGGRSLPAFAVLDAACTALSPALMLDVVLHFTAGTRAWRHVRIGVAVLAIGLAASSLVGLASTSVLHWLDSSAWAALFGPLWLGTFVFELFVVVRYLRAAEDPREKARTRLVVAALAVGGACGSSDVAHQLGFAVPYLGAVGAFVAAMLLLSLVVRLDLLDRRSAPRAALYAAVMTSALVVAYVVVLAVFAGRVGAQVLFACALGLVGAAVAREVVRANADERARTQQLALLGRFSAQMTHDLRGPLTALLGAAQMGRPDVDLVVEQAKRLADIIGRYDRMARVEPLCTLVAVGDVVRAVARSHGVSFAADDDLELDADRALVESALENVVRNAVEAAGADRVRVDARRDADGDGDVIVLRVVDEGPGMDARTLLRATEDFFTTKPNGSGLGLSFARRVAEAHGGRIALTSRPGAGTCAELRFPVRVSPETPVQEAAQAAPDIV